MAKNCSMARYRGPGLIRWGPQRVGAEEDQAQAGLGKRRLQHGLIPLHRVDRREDAVGRRPGKFDRATGFHGDPAAARQGGQRVEHRSDFVPAGPAVRGGQVVAVGLEFQAHPPQRGVHQAALGDVLRDGRESVSSAIFSSGAGSAPVDREPPQ